MIKKLWLSERCFTYKKKGQIEGKGEVERVIFQINGLKSFWLLEAYKSKAYSCRNWWKYTSGQRGIYISPHLNTRHLARGKICTIHSPIREYFENSAPRGIVHPKSRFLWERRPIIFYR